MVCLVHSPRPKNSKNISDNIEKCYKFAPIMKKLALLLLILTPIVAFSQVHKGFTSKQLRAKENEIIKIFGRYPTMFEPWKSQSERKVRLEKVSCSEGRVNLTFNEGLIQIAIREELCKEWEDQIRATLGDKYEDAKVGIFYRGIPIERYIPNVYRNNVKRDLKRVSTPISISPIVKSLDEVIFGKGLSYRTLAMWPSHGFYMDEKDTTWKFQRPALFKTIEDIHTYFWCDKYLFPMLENAGAVVISPRERDVNDVEIVLDNDSGEVELKGKWSTVQGGFKKIEKIREENPFTLGTSLVSSGLSSAIYSATLDKDGQYAVYVSYKPSDQNSKKAIYTVKHKHGESSFEVNQTIGGGWVYLSKFEFVGKAQITLSGEGQLSTDAIKIGGGFGNVERKGKISGVPRWAEAARYFLQYSGVPNDVYMPDQDKNKNTDYTDDTRGRGDWVNYLKNNLKIPVDLAFALHTNSGIIDSIFGTLAITYSNRGKDVYENGKSKFAGRDFADIVQTQVVDDIRALYDPKWVRRSIYDKSYAEVSRPDVPAMLLELLSHQNENDMNFALDNKFRFDVSRAIYKGILKFSADRYGVDYVVQPLPVSQYSHTVVGNALTLRWKPTVDSLEKSAEPTYYKVYTAINGIWNKGVKVESSLIELELPKSVVEYKVVAYNEGGKSFDLETLMFDPNAPKSLVINRIPLLDYSIVGKQVDFDKNSQFVDNNYPGYGASDKTLIFKGILSTY